MAPSNKSSVGRLLAPTARGLAFTGNPSLRKMTLISCCSLEPFYLIPDTILFFFFKEDFLKDAFLELSEGIQRINFSDSLLTLLLAGSISFSS